MVIELADPYIYYRATAGGVTHRVLDEAENLATSFFHGLDAIQNFATEHQMNVGVGKTTAGQTLFLIAKEGSKITPAVSNVRMRYVEDHPTEPDVIPANLYLPNGKVSSQILHDWAQTREALLALHPAYSNIEEVLVTRAIQENKTAQIGRAHV